MTAWQPLTNIVMTVISRELTNRHQPSKLWRVVAIRPDRDDPPTCSPPFITPPWLSFKSIANWQTVTIRHGSDGSSRSVPIGTIRPHLHPRTWHRHDYFLSLSRTDKPSQSVTVVTGRQDPSRSGRSADIFTTHHNTAMNSQTVTECHHPSR